MLATVLCRWPDRLGGTAAAPGPAAAGGAIPLLSWPSVPRTQSRHDKELNGGFITGEALETLVKYGPQGQLEPVLATSWAQASPVTWVYHLRHGVRFWDGRPLTAADVAYSLNYDRSPGSQVAFAFTDVKTITATGPYTVTVTLTQPDASWQYVPAGRPPRSSRRRTSRRTRPPSACQEPW